MADFVTEIRRIFAAIISWMTTSFSMSLTLCPELGVGPLLITRRFSTVICQQSVTSFCSWLRLQSTVWKLIILFQISTILTSVSIHREMYAGVETPLIQKHPALHSRLVTWTKRVKRIRTPPGHWPPTVLARVLLRNHCQWGGQADASAQS